jgi:1-acyl-sn-glycerol-3-phosphate acyltransferase
MKLFKEIFARFWALWGIIAFISTMLIAFIFYLPCFVIKEPYAGRWHRKVSRPWQVIFLSLIGCPFKVTGSEHFQPGKNYVVTCNHNSLFDILIATPFMPSANKTIAKSSLSYIPVFGWIYAAGSVLVNRKSDKSRRESFYKMKQMLDLGFHMVLYPEGTRNRTNDPLKSFYDGAFKLAVEAQKPIIPAIIFNTTKVLPVNKKFYLFPHKLEMHLLPSVESFNTSPKELKVKVFRIMWDYYEANK